MSSELRVRVGRLPVAVHLHGAAPSPRGPRASARPDLGGESGVAGDAAAASATERAPAPVAADGKRVEETMTALRRSVDQRLESREHAAAAELRAREPQGGVRARANAQTQVAANQTAPGFDASALVQEALARVTEGLREPKAVVVRAAPETIATLSKAIAASDAAAPGPRTHFVADPSLAPGACEVDCDMRRVKIDLSREIARIERSLLGENSQAGESS